MHANVWNPRALSASRYVGQSWHHPECLNAKCNSKAGQDRTGQDGTTGQGVMPAPREIRRRTYTLNDCRIVDSILVLVKICAQ